MGRLDKATCGEMGDVAWLTPSLQVPGGALPVICPNVSLSVRHPTCSGHPDDTGEQTFCLTCLAVPATAVQSGAPRLSKICTSLQVAWSRARHCLGRNAGPAGGGIQNPPCPNPCTYAQLGHGCTSHVPHSCFRTSMSPWQAHPEHENKYVDWFAVCKLDLLFVNGFIHHLPERAILANGLPASASSPPAVICSSSLCLSDWAPGCHVMGSLLLDSTSDIFKQNNKQPCLLGGIAVSLCFQSSKEREDHGCICRGNWCLWGG